jgi:hypothetical protein
MRPRRGDRSRQHPAARARASARAPVAAVLIALSSTAAATAAEQPQVQLTKAGQAAARAAGIIRDDVGRKAAWSGGAIRPDPSAQDDCPAYHPRRADLVLNGIAGTAYENRASGVSLRSQTIVFRARRMVRLFEQRSLLAPTLLPCVARQTAATLPETLRYVSIQHIAFPIVGSFTTAWRITLELRATGERVAIDQIGFARGRTEVNLAATYFVRDAAAVRPAEGRLALAIAQRIRV